MKKLFYGLLLTLAAVIWGSTFVAQSIGGDAVGPFSFCFLRSVLGSLVLVPVIFLLEKMGISKRKPKNKRELKRLIFAGACCGVLLSLSAMFQQVGLYLDSGVGKSGFLTTLYIIIVPILGLFLKKKCNLNVWMSVIIAMLGFYFLCLNQTSQMSVADIMTCICALMCALHIMVVDHFAPEVDVVRLSCVQFAVAAVTAFIPMFFVELHHSVNAFSLWSEPLMNFQNWIPILYAGIMSNGVAYTLQSVGQRELNPTVASLIMSLESVFSVLAGWIILGEVLTVSEGIGCILVFVAVILAQIPWKRKKESVNE